MFLLLLPVTSTVAVVEEEEGEGDGEGEGEEEAVVPSVLLADLLCFVFSKPSLPSMLASMFASVRKKIISTTHKL